GRGGRGVGGGGGVGGGVGRLRASCIGRNRVVLRHVDRLAVGGLNDDIVVRNRDCLLRSALQIAQRVGLGAQMLDRRHDVRLLVDEGIAQLGGPIQVLVHVFQHGGGMGQDLDAVVPRARL